MIRLKILITSTRPGRISPVFAAWIEGLAKTLPAFKGAAFCRDAYDCVKGADAAALVSEWDEFKSLDLKRLHKLMRIPLILDGRNLYDPAVLRGAGFTYCSVGRP